MLSTSKIIADMEIGHNVMHGQWDWMRDPSLHSTTFEWGLRLTAEGEATPTTTCTTRTRT